MVCSLSQEIIQYVYTTVPAHQKQTFCQAAGSHSDATSVSRKLIQPPGALLDSRFTWELQVPSVMSAPSQGL